jgi:PII-like signaling protein
MMTYSNLSIVRVYLRRGATATTRGAHFLRRWLPRPLSHQLVEDALHRGVVYAAVTLGHVGYVGAARCVSTGGEHSVESLPQCVEFVAPQSVLQAFLAEHDADLAESVIVWLDGAGASARTPA